MALFDDHRPEIGSPAFSEWTTDRAVSVLSTNAGAAPIAFQEWRKFKEAFAPELVANAIAETEKDIGRAVQRVVDPFGGSGTTALTAQFLGTQCTTIEVNPFLADLIEAKLASYDYDELTAAYLDVVNNITASRDSAPFAHAPASFVEPGVKERFLFSAEVAASLCNLLWTIETRVAEKGIRRLLKVLGVSLSVDVSNVVISGKGRRYKRNWKQTQCSGDEVLIKFKSKVESALYDIRRFSNRATTGQRVIRGDARQLSAELGPFDLAIFSPPYPNSFDYTDVYNVELWVGGYLSGPSMNRELREQTLRSHVQIKRDFSSTTAPSPTLAKVLGELDRVKASLWDKSIPSMVGAYFDDMRCIIRNLRADLSIGGRMYLAVGDSQYAGVTIPVAQILSETSIDDGFTVISATPFRSMRVSPQQGGTASLPETLLKLRRDWP